MTKLSLDSSIVSRLFLQPDMLPPISMRSLRELDPMALESNLQVMHDLMMEPGLKLKKNKEVEERPSDYWTALKRDCDLMALCRSEGRNFKVPSRLELLLTEMKAIILDMHQKSDRVKHDMREYFDIPLILQELESGQFSLPGFIAMLADLLKANCAPCRDGDVEKLVEMGAKGDIIGSMKHCLELLELMKLDLANHHLKRLRETVSVKAPMLERNHFKLAAKDRGLMYAGTREWLAIATKNWPPSQDEEASAQVYLTYVNALLDLVIGLSSELKTFPETLVLDEIRVGNLRTEVQDLCILSCVLSLFHQSTRKQCSITTAKQAEKLKGEVSLILKKDSAELAEISRALVVSVEKVLGSPLKAKDRALLHGMCDKLIEPENAYYVAVERKLAEFVRRQLLSRDARAEDMAAAGFRGLEKEAQECAQRISRLATVNWLIHSETYIGLHK
jgi:hypothetical protein